MVPGPRGARTMLNPFRAVGGPSGAASPASSRSHVCLNLLAACQSKLDLGDAARIEIHLERYERHALSLDGAKQTCDLARMQQELAGPRRRMAVPHSLRVFADMSVDQIDLACLV